MLAFGLLASTLLSLTPESPFSTSSRAQVCTANRRLSSIQEADENAARKASIVDNGSIVSPIEGKKPLEEAFKEALSAGKSKEKKEN
jgi:hypothetical protein